MTGAAPSHAAPPGAGSALAQVGWIAKRSLRTLLRQPAAIVPSLVFPLFLLALNSGGLASATKIPGFPTGSYVNFALAVCFMQGGLFAAINAGTALATDIENGFLNRLQMTPLRGWAVLVGQLAGAVALGAIAAVVYVTVGLIFGVHIEAGVPGLVVLLLLAVLTAVALGSLGSWMAGLSGSAEAVQGLFPLLFVLLFLSSSSLPRNLIDVGWFRTIATINPFSYLIEGMRSLVVTGWDGEALAKGFGVALAILAVGMTLSTRALKTRMGRT